MQRNASSGLVSHWGLSAAGGWGGEGLVLSPLWTPGCHPQPVRAGPPVKHVPHFPTVTWPVRSSGMDVTSHLSKSLGYVGCCKYWLAIYQTWSEHLLLLPERIHVSDRGGDILLWFRCAFPR